MNKTLLQDLTHWGQLARRLSMYAWGNVYSYERVPTLRYKYAALACLDAMDYLGGFLAARGYVEEVPGDLRRALEEWTPCARYAPANKRLISAVQDLRERSRAVRRAEGELPLRTYYAELVKMAGGLDRSGPCSFNPRSTSPLNVWPLIQQMVSLRYTPESEPEPVGVAFLTLLYQSLARYQPLAPCPHDAYPQLDWRTWKP